MTDFNDLLRECEDKKAGVTRTQIKKAITRIGKHLKVSGPAWRWDVTCNFGNDSDPYPYRDLTDRSTRRGDWDGGWGGHLTDRKHLYKHVEMGRGADIYVYHKTGFDKYSGTWSYELVGSFTFTLPDSPDGDIRIKPILDHMPNQTLYIPFKEDN